MAEEISRLGLPIEDRSSEQTSYDATNQINQGLETLGQQPNDDFREEGHGTLNMTDAHEQAKAENPIRILISNVNRSGLSENNKGELVEKLEHESEQLLEKVKKAQLERYQRIERVYKSLEEDIITRVAESLTNQKFGPIEILNTFGVHGMAAEDSDENYSSHYDDNERITQDTNKVSELSLDQCLKLRTVTYALLGAEPPEINPQLPQDKKHEFQTITTPIDGDLVIVERVNARRGYNNSVERGNFMLTVKKQES